MTRTLWLFLLFYAVPVWMFANESPLSVRELRCEFRNAPAGVDHVQPRLGWELMSKDPMLHNQVQTAYQILVASSLSLLEEGKADGWNSGRVEGNANGNIYYKGKPLVSGGVYYWKVRIWDGGNMVSSWSKPSQWSMGLLSPGDWGAEWVMDSKTPVADDSLLYQDNPAPLFRKELEAGANIRKAVLYISGIGYYRATLNGGAVGDHFLDPGWTDYRKTVPYNTFDVTAMIKGGRNCLSVELGNGWYDPLPLRMWGSLNMRKFLPTGKPRFIARLEIEYADGRHQTVVSDGSWKVTDGPLRRNNNYIGSTYDDRYDLPGWDNSGYEDSKWRKALVTSGPGGELISQEHPPIRTRMVLHPVSIRQMGKGKYMVDMGQNFGGIVRLVASGKKGTRIQLRYGELLYPDGSLNVMTSVAGQVKRQGAGGPGAPPIAWQQDDLILGDGKVIFEPAFTFHGFRYVEVDGYPGVLTKEMIQGITLSSDVRPAGSFTCSDSLFGSIQAATLRTFLSNLFSVQSDCPHREKLGYGGDIVATSEAFMANYNMHDLYAKAVRDFSDEAQPDGALPETAPYVGIADNGVTRTAGPIGWGTVLPLLLRQLYQYYGDSGLVAKYYPAARGWVDLLHAHAKGFIIKEGIGDHESLDPKQVEVTSTAFLYYNTELLQQLAVILGRQEDAQRYGKLAAEVKAAFIKNFYDPATGAVGIHTQATQAFALYFHLLPEGGEEKALKVLLDEVHNKKDHVSTGIFGTKYLLEVLSEHGMSELACKIAGQKDLPGWGNMLAQGATTLWEHWEFSDNTYSHNHPMFGSISGWFYKYLAGIRPAEDAVGYNKIILQPGGFEQLRFVKGRWASPQGTIISEWSRNGDSLFYDIAVPVNTSATVLLPGQAPQHVGSGHYRYHLRLQSSGGGHIVRMDDHPRIINIVNFIRWLEPRDAQITKDVLYQTVVKQVALMKANRLGGTFLLQYDALIDPRYQELLRGLSRDSFEVGAWWELPQQLVEKAGLKWRGRYSWDWRADVGFAAGYSVEDRKKLVDVYMEDFKQAFGVYPQSVGSWYIDAYTLDYMYTKYGIRASCNCKDQVGTDGYTLWGGYWNQAYYPSKLSAYMPAQHPDNQIPVPIFRMLGSDPIRQYEDGLAGGRQGVVTLEPVYKDAGGDETWVKWYLKQLVEGPCMEYGYAQAGQENSFTWNGMAKGLELQFPLIARLRDEGKLKVETLGASGKWFKEHYAVTPATAVTVKEDLPNSQNRKTVWFDSRWYRANLIWANGTMRWRDIHLFDEGMAGDSRDANLSTVSVMSTLPLVDGLWSGKSVEASLRLMVKEEELKGGDPVVSDSVPGKLSVRWPLPAYDAVVVVELTEREMRVKIEGKAPEGWYLSLKTGENAKLPFVKVRQGAVDSRYEGRDYSVRALSGSFSKGDGSSVWMIRPGKDGVALQMGIN